MIIQWRIHLQSPLPAVYHLLSTNDGRARFWAEEAAERDGYIEFRFPGGQRWRGHVLAREQTMPFDQVIFNYAPGQDEAGKALPACLFLLPTRGFRLPRQPPPSDSFCWPR
jgi:hypothetical protein